MKFTLGVLLVLFLVSTNSYRNLKGYDHSSSPQLEESFLMTFECYSCTKRNKFQISGPEEHIFNAVEFPLKVKLKPGEYDMTYWQNRVQQIHLPFDVGSEFENKIVVKH